MTRILFALLSILFLPSGAFAGYEIETLPGVEVSNDFVVGPGKSELTINPGETKTVNITVTNRLGEEKVFMLETEDFGGSKNPEETVILYGENKGPYSLKDYLRYESKEFTLGHGERATIPVRISVPANAEPGGLYGSVLASVVSRPQTSTGSAGSAIISRIGSLFFVKVPGEVKEEGRLTKSELNGGKKVLTSGPFFFQLYFENTGSVYLNPYGDITIKNIFGSTVASLEVDPWFALPGSLRFREKEWTPGFLLGYYTATVNINRGYGDVVDTQEISFLVFPTQTLLGIFFSFLAVFLVVRFLSARFEIKRKTQ